MKIKFITLGCKVNQYETKVVEQYAKEKGHLITNENETADAVVINTCTVTAVSDKKCRQIIRKNKKENNNSIIAVMGCYSQVSPDDVSAIDGVDIVMGNAGKTKIIDKIENLFKSRLNLPEIKENRNIIDVENIFDYKDFEYSFTTNFDEKTRATIKIQDGCENFCTYCIIPFARGRVRSKSIDDILNEVTAISKNGYKEIVLTGIHLDSYGKDLENVTLADVINKCNGIKGIERIRLGSLEPVIITRKFLNEIKNANKLCPHFHLSLQSGCDNTLKAMKRNYDTRTYLKACELLREYYPNVAITTDIMVGFPGETNEDFEDSVSFAKTVLFAQAHVFPYSRRKGTIADKMDGQILNEVKQERTHKMIETVTNTQNQFRKDNLGLDNKVLFEKEIEENVYEGYTENYIPVKVFSEKSVNGKILNVTLLEVDGDLVIGKIKED